MGSVKLIPKLLNRKYVLENDNIIPKDREFIVEVDNGVDEESTTYRFKIGDGKTVYSKLPYISSIYALFPKFMLYSKQYDKSVEVNFRGE